MPPPDPVRILDADRHVVEPVGLWREYLPRELRVHAPYLEPASAPLGPGSAMPRSPSLMLAGEPVMHKLSERARGELMKANYRRALELREGTSPDGQLRAMDRTGIDVAVLYPTYASYVIGVDFIEPELGAALARAYNDWLHDFCAPDRARLLGMGLISLHDPARAAAEVERVAGRGWRGVVLRPNPVYGRTLGDPAYEPFWAACVHHALVVAVHEGTHARQPTAGADRFHSRFALHACSHPMELMMAFLALYEGGVLERHPGLRVAFLEAGCGWVPYWLWRLDEEYRHLAGELDRQVSAAPSVVFQRQCFVGFEPGEPYLDDVVARLGSDKLLFGSDFPHVDHDDDLVAQARRLGERLPEPALRALLWENSARFYGLVSSSR